MNPNTIQPFYFPTTVMLVDDSLPFLANVGLQLHSQLAFKLFHSPFTALAALNDEHNEQSINSEIFSLYRYREDADFANHVINVSLDKVHREIYNEHRFAQMSVVVIDYDMPNMNGLEFCCQINNPSIKKILLTGKADEQTAIQAFNAKTIDRFIRKQDPNAMVLLRNSIAELQQEYFQQVEHMLSGTLSVGAHMFLRDAAFVQRFQEIQQERSIVEHYLTWGPNGILMLDATGTSYLLLVQDEKSMQAMYEVAYDQDAPTELLEQLRSGQFLPYFWQTEGHYAPVYTDWQNYMYPASSIHGENIYTYGLVPNPKGFTQKYVKSYNEYLEQLD